LLSIEIKPLVTESLSKQIAENLREAIINGTLKVDEQLPTEHELAARFKVSRPTIREAFKRLAAQNLIRSRRGPSGGTFVNRPTHEDLNSSMSVAAMLLVNTGEFSLADIADARRELEGICCRLAAEKRTDGDLQSMAAELEIQKKPELSAEDFCAADVRFHRALVNATGNPVLKFVMFAVIEALQPATNMVIFRFRKRETIVAQHERICAAIECRDAVAAQSALAEQMDYLCEQYRQAQQWREQRDKTLDASGSPIVS
jgi:DNA-binding FadR family transcriptional regulator